MSPGPDVVARTVTAVTLAVAFGLLALGVDAFWVAFPVGFGGVLPLAVSLAATDGADTGASGESAEPAATGTVDRAQPRDGATDRPDAASALAGLRRRYARGELTDEGFERRLEALLAGGDTLGSGRGPGVGSQDRAERDRERTADPNA